MGSGPNEKQPSGDIRGVFRGVFPVGIVVITSEIIARISALATKMGQIRKIKASLSC